METIARGLEGVVLTETRLSHVDGERGELLIGGFPVEELAPHASFEEVLFLLWNGRLPSDEESAALAQELTAARWMPERTARLLRDAAATRTAPMDALRMGVASLPDPCPDEVGPEAQRRRAISLVARFPTLVAASWRAGKGLEPKAPQPDLGHVANYLYMLTGEEPAPAVVRALETYFNTVVDHGMNASTFTARVIASTGSDLVSALAGAVGALKGPLHGGAPGPALDTVFEIRERAARSGRPLAVEAEARVREILAAGDRLMGFGHRVYKVRDPRAEVLGRAATDLFTPGGGDRALYDDAMEIEKVILRVLHEHKPGQRLETNVEFYTALLLHGIGLEVDLFSPTFAAARAGGWTAHVLEQLNENRLIRPASLFVGERRHWSNGEALTL